jgi:ATP-binding cassette subfamily F protein 3
MIDKIERIELEPEQDEIVIELPEIPRGGNDVVVIRNLAKQWLNSDGSANPVFSGLSATVRYQDRIAVMGVNGAGKSTFLKVLCGLTEPSAGEAIVGPSISIGYFGQVTIESMDPERTVLQELQNKLPLHREAHLRNLLAAFLFRGDEVYKKVKVLSGGEKARVVLASLLSLPHNCLVLDEPTNHLDIASRTILLDALKRFTGTMLLVSHDRYFLREITTRVFEVGHGTIAVYEGNYDSYLEMRRPSGRS